MKTTRSLLAAAASATLLAAVAPAFAAKAPARSASYLKPVVPFIENDYGRALAEAHARRVPLFVEAWAPW